ncbi:glutathione s-transferase [Diplodia corticola]|uniref:Glutathione s-transferase n=1 Tax=Diplodia corticola TaxID=236234 RepID=A0A1J9SFJ2_9PEZI|nr:glutathione s-transferase [Diplodia corticola]OJD38588.1 glutathione s-transferase [Diplodia corticola]
MSPTPKLILYRGWDDPGNYVWSPFVTKVELRLRAAGVEYKAASGSVKSAPRGKIPYLTINETESLSDSTLIIENLTSTGLLPDVNATLGPAQRAHDRALCALLEDKLYFYHVSAVVASNYYAMRDHVLCALSYPVRVVVGLLIHRGVKSHLHGQGTGRFTAEEIAAFRRQIWESFDDLLREAKGKQSGTADGEKPFWIMAGDGPTEADTVLFGFVVSVLICTASPESQEVVRSFPTVLEYAENPWSFLPRLQALGVTARNMALDQSLMFGNTR